MKVDVKAAKKAEEPLEQPAGLIHEEEEEI